MPHWSTMKNSVIICGLYYQDYQGQTEDSLKEIGDLWVLNDWYQFLPFIWVPDRIWNIHKITEEIKISGRYPGNWKLKYNYARCPVMISEKIEGIKYQRLIEKEKLNQFGYENCSCQLSTMIYHAIIEGYENITLIGVGLNKDEYKYQARGILKAISECEKRGINIKSIPDNRINEIKKKFTSSVDWANIEPVKAPYWSLGPERHEKEIAI